MKCTVKGNKKLRSYNTSYCLIEVVTKAGLTVLASIHSEHFYVIKLCNHEQLSNKLHHFMCVVLVKFCIKVHVLTVNNLCKKLCLKNVP